MNQIINKFSTYLLQAGVDETFVNHSVWRIENNFFEHRHAYLQNNEIALIMGGDNNLVLALLIAYIYPFAKVILIEDLKDLQRKIVKVSKLLKINNLFVGAELHQIVDLIGENSIGWCLVDLETNMDFDQLEGIVRSLKIRQIAGEVDDTRIPESSLRSLLAKNVQRYFFHFCRSRKVISGRGCRTRPNHDEPQISIIVPVHNNERYLPYCLSSLTQSSDLDQEILVINDGSTDNSENIARDFERNFPDVHVINKPNGGCASARSEGLRVARGEYIGFVDSDDWIDKGMFDDLYDSALAYQSDIAYCGFRKVQEHDNQVIEDPEKVKCSEGNCNGLVEVLDQLYYLQPSIWRSIFKRSFIEKHGLDFPHQIKRFDDLYFKFVTLSMAKRVSFVPRTYYNYRIGQIGQDIAANDERLYTHFQIFDLLKDYIQEIGDEKMEWRLKLVELDTHKWGRDKIIPRLKWPYIEKAALNFSRTVYISRYWVPVYAFRHFSFSHSRFAALLTLLG